MRIGIDIDGVLCNIVNFISERMHFKYDCNRIAGPWNVQTYSLSQSFPCHPEEVKKEYEIFIENPSVFIEMPSLLNDEQWKQLNAAAKKHEVFFISYRAKDDDPRKLKVQLYTENWLKKNGIEFPKVIITEKKEEMVKHLQLDAFIDDDPKNFNTIAKNCPNTKVFTMPWNYSKNNIDYKEVDVVVVNNVLDVFFYLENIDIWRKEFNNLQNTKTGKLKSLLAKAIFEFGYLFYKTPTIELPFKYKTFAYGAYYENIEEEKGVFHSDKHVPHQHDFNYMISDVIPICLSDLFYNISDKMGKYAEEIHPLYYCDCKGECDCFNHFALEKLSRTPHFPDEEDLKETKIYFKYRHPAIYAIWDTLESEVQYNLFEIYEMLDNNQIKYYDNQSKIDARRMIDPKLWEGKEYCQNKIDNIFRPSNAELLKKYENYLNLYDMAIEHEINRIKKENK